MYYELNNVWWFVFFTTRVYEYNHVLLRTVFGLLLLFLFFLYKYFFLFFSIIHQHTYLTISLSYYRYLRIFHCIWYILYMVYMLWNIFMIRIRARHCGGAGDSRTHIIYTWQAQERVMQRDIQIIIRVINREFVSITKGLYNV